jgi:predicted RNase H-like nuclease (RuvC/YqgF family)
MFSNKKLKETEDALAATNATLQKVQQELALANEKVSQQANQLQNLNNELTLQKDQLLLSAQQSAALLEKYSPLLQVDKETEERKNQVQELSNKYASARLVYQELEQAISLYEDVLEIGSFGLYKPQFNFDTAEQFKQAIENNYEKQKELIKEEKAIVCHKEWVVAGSKAEGKKMTTQYKKLMLFAFNGECDALISRIKWNNAEKTRERINKAFEAINKLGASHEVEITAAFLALKQDELSLTYEHEQKKYEEKEEQRMLREQMREEERAQREFERAQQEAEEEEERYEKALEKARKELSLAGGANVDVLQDKINALEVQLQEAHQKKERAIAMAQLTKVGHIYVISNIGSFGEDVYKLGMTRRLDPLDRVRELGDASVPFLFDVHAIIYSENAPQLENDLHKKFNDRRLNRINTKKEFFRVTLDEIEAFVREHTGASIEFTKAAEARDYRETLTLLEQLKLQEAVQEDKMEKFPKDLLI